MSYTVLIFLVQQVLELGTGGVGVFAGVLAVGMIVGAVSLGFVKREINQPMVVVGAMLVYGVLFLASPLLLSATYIAVAALVAGIGSWLGHRAEHDAPGGGARRNPGPHILDARVHHQRHVPAHDALHRRPRRSDVVQDSRWCPRWGPVSSWRRRVPPREEATPARHWRQARSTGHEALDTPADTEEPAMPVPPFRASVILV